MKAVPWQHVHNWTCIGCGQCCRLQVQLLTNEWLDLTRNYGYTIATQNVDGLFINKTPDGWCPFLYRTGGGCLCSLQQTKPLACRLWPFRVSDYPRHGYREEATYQYRGKTFYVYLIPFCGGITYGRPSEHLVRNVIPEFIDMRTGLQRAQYFSTRSKYSTGI